jgi:hypothetical protein
MLIDEHTGEYLAIVVSQSLKREEVLERSRDLFLDRGVPGYRRSANGSEFKVVKVPQ